MARYIDADALRERLEIINVMDEDWYGMGISTGLYKADKEVCEMPTADVVPREDYEELAREIFNDIQSCVVHRNWDEWGENIRSFVVDADKYAELKEKYTKGGE